MSRTLRPLAALALVALISAGCGSNAPSETGTASSTGTGSGADKKLTAQEKAVKFAECMRAHGVRDFPDPNAKGEFEYRGQRDPRGVEEGHHACKDLQPPGTLSSKRTPKQQSASLQVRPVHPRERREGLSGPRQR